MPCSGRCPGQGMDSRERSRVVGQEEAHGVHEVQNGGELVEPSLELLVELTGDGQLHADPRALGLLWEGRWTPRRGEVVVHGVDGML